MLSHSLPPTPPLGGSRKDQSIQIWKPKYEGGDQTPLEDTKSSKQKLKVVTSQKKKKIHQKSAVTDPGKIYLQILEKEKEKKRKKAKFKAIAVFTSIIDTPQGRNWGIQRSYDRTVGYE